ncbi:hypothetical protein J1C67_00045 [Clostridium gasigenes]|uniref:hypothetical protein n=1 Tax=Clostridium gasigenes TaxID=94869 RepID=UPI00143861D4|nr:hypothetical protein [Clostridium gasigenes]NKF07112.1 hypothetical protein [Clostridium gasigenes]QSW19637.1 hypothetical protein J1C67_00045 [Clostridium gasigenes]
MMTENMDDLSLEIICGAIIKMLREEEDPDGNEGYIRFIEDLRFIAEVHNDTIKDEKDKVDEAISRIQDFIDARDSHNRDMKDLFGLIGEKKETYNFDQTNKSYYFFVGDLKMKAFIFLLRAYRFIQKYLSGNEPEDASKPVSELKQMINMDLYQQIFADDSSRYKSYVYEEDNGKYSFRKHDGEAEEPGAYLDVCSEEIKELIEKLQNIKEKGSDNIKAYEVEIVEIEDFFGKSAMQYKGDKIKGFSDKIPGILEGIMDYKVKEGLEESKDRNKKGYAKYFLFDNGMHEVSWYGVESEFSWLWEQHENVTLFRNVSEKSEGSQQESKNRVSFMQTMFSEIISHLNGASVNNCSYSKNPIRDIYKYVQIADGNMSTYVISIDNTKLKCIEDGNSMEQPKCRFGIVCNATTNSIKTNNKEESFYNFVIGEEALGDGNPKYSIEPFLINSATSTKKGRRAEQFCEYLNSWKELEKKVIYSKVSENDDEIITSYNYFEEVNVSNQDDEIKQEDGKEYIFDFAKKEFVYLMYYIFLDEKNLLEQSVIKSMKEAFKIKEKVEAYRGNMVASSSDNDPDKYEGLVLECEGITIKIREDARGKIFEDEIDTKKNADEISGQIAKLILDSIIGDPDCKNSQKINHVVSFIKTYTKAREASDLVGPGEMYKMKNPNKEFNIWKTILLKGNRS